MPSSRNFLWFDPEINIPRKNVGVDNRRGLITDDLPDTDESGRETVEMFVNFP